MTNTNLLRGAIWQQNYALNFEKKDNFISIHSLGDFNQSLLRLKITGKQKDGLVFDNTHFYAGKLLVKLKQGVNLFLIDSKSLNFGENLIFLDNRISNDLSLFYVDDLKLKGKFTIKTYKLAIQVTNFNGTTVTLGDEAYLKIANLNKALTNEITDAIKTQVNISVNEAVNQSQTINSINTNIVNITSLLSI
jgi:hypothetical protein